MCLGIVAVLAIAAAMCVTGPGGNVGQPGGNQTQTACSNKICEDGENCWNCGADCSCGSGQYCSSTTKACTSTVCGNSICEPFEGSENCCLDCKCSVGQACNQATKACETQAFTVSDNRAKEIAAAHFNGTASSTQIIGFGTFFGKLVKVVRVETTDGGIDYVGVGEDEKAETLPVL